MSRAMACLFLLITLASALPSGAQVQPGSSRPLLLAGYATASGASPELGKGTELGMTGGFVVDHSRFLALDARGMVLAALQPQHILVAESGPRITPVSYRNLRPYAEVLAGLAHTEYGTHAHPPIGKGFGLAWTATFGADLELRRGFTWRVAEYSYTHIYAGSGVTPSVLNTGILYRF